MARHPVETDAHEFVNVCGDTVHLEVAVSVVLDGTGAQFFTARKYRRARSDLLAHLPHAISVGRSALHPDQWAATIAYTLRNTSHAIESRSR